MGGVTAENGRPDATERINPQMMNTLQCDTISQYCAIIFHMHENWYCLKWMLVSEDSRISSSGCTGKGRQQETNFQDEVLTANHRLIVGIVWSHVRGT